MSKRKWHHPEVAAGERSAKVWRSTGELEDSSHLRQWIDREFPRASESMRDEKDQEQTRRDFLKLMGASTALAGFGLAACRRPEKYIVPFIDSKQAEWTIPGQPTYYATAMPSAEGAATLLATVHEGRPTMLGPNKRYEKQQGVGTFAQASILNLYNPARSRDFLAKGQKLDRAVGVEALEKLLVDSQKLAVVIGEDQSPTRAKLLKQVTTNKAGTKVYRYEALSGLGRTASEKAIFGKKVTANVDFTKAKYILSADCDFLGLDSRGSTKEFYNRRRPEGADYAKDGYEGKSDLNRLYSVEPAYTVTGGVADHRAPLAPSQMGRFLGQIAAELGVSVAGLEPFDNEGEKAEWVKQCALDLKQHASEAVVLLGSRYDKELHDLVYLINEKLGKLVTYSDQGAEQAQGGLTELLSDMESGAVDTLLLLTPANPVYENPAVEGKKFNDVVASKGVKTIHWGERTDATANTADLHIPAANYLESWGDSFTRDGDLVLVQPMILPLYNGVQQLELLAALVADKFELFDQSADANAESPAYTAVRENFRAIEASDKAWIDFQRTGFYTKKNFNVAASGVAPTAPTLKAQPEPSIGQFDLVFATDSSVFDGRYIDNAWLQEAPDPISKLTWDNAVYMSPQTAKDLGLYKEIVELEQKEAVWWSKLGIATDKKIKTTAVPEDGEGPSLYGPMINVGGVEAVVIVAFGMADNVLSLPLGYGQGYDKYWEDDFKGGLPAFYKQGKKAWNTSNVSLVGVNRGFNSYQLRGDADYFISGEKAQKVEGVRYKLARTQEHHAMYGRAIAREISTMDAHKDSGAIESYDSQLKNVQKQGMDSHVPDNFSLYYQEKTNHLSGETKRHLWDETHQWAMTIDLSTCTGCNSCLVACQAENNIPVVGKTQVAMGREMHWIRMDRYFAEPHESAHHGGEHKEHAGASNPSREWGKPLEMIPNPMACVQCESAPCETVCPVNATVHSEDGLNTMAYNRCIGTRYCANNCPYKARRFNFFDYNKRNPLVHKNLYKGPFGKKQQNTAQSLQRNPNVSVRMRGVMEKCTYCVQRLQGAKIKAKQNLKKLVLQSGKTSDQFKFENPAEAAEALRAKTNSVTVACQDACEAGAIVFGNLKDKNDLIQRTRGQKENEDIGRNFQRKFTNPRTYDVLNYINTRPRTSYMARVKNPNKNMPGADKVGGATIHMA